MAIYSKGVIINQSQFNSTGYDPSLYGYIEHKGEKIPFIAFLDDGPLKMDERYRLEKVTWHDVAKNPIMWGMTELQAKKLLAENEETYF
ncbi:hypothetical protein UFOVP826_22 [uncultured Caudovirales phage]|uniref:Uncharacterized protein n=1 Tax=uncultured Caudovirales phage TaxID=2100421 RepID=A0A6J5P9W9_9CAUD|nr:hypothetical protein UFOVP826_22 [uncultured Caudovirales phage]